MSYGVNAPQGFVPYKYWGGASYDGKFNSYYFDPSSLPSMSIYTGDPVIATSAGYVTGLAAADYTTTQILGIFAGCRYVSNVNTGLTPYQNQPAWLSGTTPQTGTLVEAFVIDDPMVIFNVQFNNASSTQATAQSLVFSNFGFTIEAGNAVTGQSQSYIKTTSASTGSDRPFKCLGMTKNPQNWMPQQQLIATQYTNFLVKLNNCVVSPGTTGI